MRLRDLFHRAKGLLGGRGVNLGLKKGVTEPLLLPDFVQAFVLFIAAQEELRSDFLHLVDAEPLRRAEILSSWLQTRSKHVQQDGSVKNLCDFFAQEASFQSVVTELERICSAGANAYSQIPRVRQRGTDSKEEYPIAS
jgi:hypothetical protein